MHYFIAEVVDRKKTQQKCKSKMRSNVGFLKIWMRQTIFYVCWNGNEELRKTKKNEQNPKQIENYRITGKGGGVK